MEAVLIVTTLSLFLHLFCGTQGVAVRDHVDLRGYVDCGNLRVRFRVRVRVVCPLNYEGFGIGLFYARNWVAFFGGDGG